MVATKNISTEASTRRALQIELGLPYYQVKTLADLTALITANQVGIWRIVGTIALTGNITIPAGVTLEFHGGTLSGQTITGTSTRVIHLNTACFIDTILSGTWIGSIDTRCFQLTSTDDREMIKSFCKFESVDIHRDINLRTWGSISIANNLIINGNGYNFNILINDKGSYAGTWGAEAVPDRLFEITPNSTLKIKTKDLNIIDDKTINGTGADLSVLSRYHIFVGTTKQLEFENVNHRSAGGLYKAYNYAYDTDSVIFKNVKSYCTDFFTEIFATESGATHGTLKKVDFIDCQIDAPSNRHFVGTISIQGGWVEDVRFLSSKFKDLKNGNFELCGLNSLTIDNCVLQNTGIQSENISTPNRRTKLQKITNTDFVLDGLVVSDAPFKFGNCDDLVMRGCRLLISDTYTQRPNQFEIENCNSVLFQDILLDNKLIPTGWHAVFILNDTNSNVFLKNYIFRCVALSGNNAFYMPTTPIVNDGASLINCSV